MPTMFDSRDDAYQDWLLLHPRGYVVNARRRLSPGYMVLHTAQCRTIRTYTGTTPMGAFTERGYVKVCAMELNDLRGWVRRHGRQDGSFSKGCS